MYLYTVGLLTPHTLATLSRILGHTSVEVTGKAYLDIVEDDLRVKYNEKIINITINNYLRNMGCSSAGWRNRSAL